jgi:monoamine oxidase
MQEVDYDTLIIGAGVAGLAAGRLLAQAGTDLAVIEARERVGGRVFTRHVADAGGELIAVELGAEFVHGLPSQTWTLLREAGLHTQEVAGSRLHFDDGGLYSADHAQNDDDDDEDEQIAVLERMVAWAAAQPPHRDVSFAQYVQLAGIDAAARSSAVAYVEGFNAADSNVISVAALALQQRAEDAIHAERLFRVREGYDALPKFLAREIEQAGATILLGASVRRIVWRRGAVTLQGIDRGGREFALRSRRALITLPLGVLQSGTVQFAPAPADVLTCAQRLAMGPVVRVSLLFRSRFWRELGPDAARLSFLFTRQLPPTWWTPMPDTAPLLTAWAGGPAALALPRPGAGQPGVPTDDALLERCLATLARVFDQPVGHLKEQLLSWHSHDWQADEYSCGAYSYVPSGALAASMEMAQPVQQSLYFAGEHILASGHWGTVHGALESGLRAATQMLSGG